MDRVLPRTVPLLQSRDTFRNFLGVLRSWRQRMRTRRQLAALDSRQLADVGISPSERQEELTKPFWR